jgi:7-cyano-7-deazaguanine reductase
MSMRLGLWRPAARFRSAGELMRQDDFKDLTVLRKSESRYPDKPQEAPLESFANKYPSRDYVVEFDCPEFTSIGPVTGQPDFARIKITYIPDRKCLESKSLKMYLFSFRNVGMFHEEIVNKVLEDLVEACNPRWARVRGLMNSRGGISIDVTAEYCDPDHHPPVGFRS